MSELKSPFRHARNARLGARQMYRDRWFLRKCIWSRTDKRGRIKGLRNMLFPRLTFHVIYISKFGVKKWWTT